MSSETDPLSSIAREILKLDAVEAYSRLVVTEQGNPRAKALLQNTRAKDLIEPPPLADHDGVKAMLAGLWLWHDFLEQSHVISQKIDSPTGSFWHAIMHRREGDFSNSKYWYAKCGGHPILPVLAAQAGPMLNPLPADKLLLRLISDGWDANALVDLIEAVHDRPDDPRHRAAVALQQLEWRVLFDHCARQAAGKSPL